MLSQALQRFLCSRLEQMGNYSNPVHSYQVHTYIAGYVTAFLLHFKPSLVEL
jgi:hypothetical protein